VLILYHPLKHLLVVLLLWVELLQLKHSSSIGSFLHPLDLDIKEVFEYLEVQVGSIWRLLHQFLLVQVLIQLEFSLFTLVVLELLLPLSFHTWQWLLILGIIWLCTFELALLSVWL
jgi:hypothetical protein